VRVEDLAAGRAPSGETGPYQDADPVCDHPTLTLIAVARSIASVGRRCVAQAHRLARQPSRARRRSSSAHGPLTPACEAHSSRVSPVQRFSFNGERPASRLRSKGEAGAGRRQESKPPAPVWWQGGWRRTLTMEEAQRFFVVDALACAGSARRQLELDPFAVTLNGQGDLLAASRPRGPVAGRNPIRPSRRRPRAAHPDLTPASRLGLRIDGRHQDPARRRP